MWQVMILGAALSFDFVYTIYFELLVAFIILHVALGAIFLKEREHLVKKFIGGIIVVAGVLLI